MLLRGDSPSTLATMDRTMLDYARQLTAQPWTITKQDILRLRSVGFSDKAILQINLVVDYFNFVNRLASGLGVELESYWAEQD